MEVWEPVKGFEGYMVSSLGRVMSVRYGQKIMKTGVNDKGYSYICLTKNKQKQTKTVHRLMAEAFLPPVEGKLTVDHIDRNPGNNSLSNLRWADRSEQSVNRNAYSNSLHKNISRSKVTGWYHVVIKRNKAMVANWAFPTLEEAIFHRDSFLATENLETL
jgi:hypothetical protein